MNHFIDITLLSDPEFPITVLLNSLYTKLHKALHDLNSTNIGVSFPKYNVILGNVLRIHGQNADLENLQILNWIGGMGSFCHISRINKVPTAVKFRTISRKQVTMSHAKLKRLIKRGSISESKIEQYQAALHTKNLNLPYVQLVSSSNGQRYRRYIVFGELMDKPIHGQFDQFGLSKNATVPWFD